MSTSPTIRLGYHGIIYLVGAVRIGVVMLFLPVLAGALSAQQTQRFDRPALENTEDRTESLANHLLELSVATRQKDHESIAAFFSASFSSDPFPSTPGDEKRIIKWIFEHGWSAGLAKGKPKGRAEFLESFHAFLDHFRSIDDARFKVKSSAVATDGRTATGLLKLFLVGRDREGRREWVRGLGDFRAQRQKDGKWQFATLNITEIRSQIAIEDLFDEVGGPIGFTATDSSFLSKPGRGLLSHGAAAADVDNDGQLDLFSPGIDRNFLYLNKGKGVFEEVASKAGVEISLHAGIAALFLDYDNDGDVDLFMSSVGDQMLFQNRLVPDGRLFFLDVSEQAGVSIPAYGFSSVTADINRDGWPDIYVASYNNFGKVVPDSWYGATNGTPNLLFINDGNNRFREAAGQWGVRDTRWSYAAAFADIDDDGDLDLYVANDFGGGNSLYLNQLVQGEQRFIEAAEERGVLDKAYGMGVSFGDFDNDGDLDLHVTKMSSNAGNRILNRLFPGMPADQVFLKKLAAGNSLYENLGDGKFKDQTADAGPFSAGWAWGGGFIDFDNDGREDLYTPNGFLSGKTMKDT
ncbi:MAG: VCBS repeat-containing protein [Acidobacteria bacterium]|nr:VCBS repeat-containing protein [Acidobacteriota bacterium]